MKPLPWVYFAALAAGLAYAWRVRRGHREAADQDLTKLRQLQALGIPLEDPQDVTFILILWTEGGARRLARELGRLGFRTEVEAHGVDGEWTCLAVREMQVTIETLRDLRRHFEALVQAEGGAYDGWELGYEPSDSSA